MYDKLSDNELIALYKKGDTEAFECLYKRYSGLIKKISRSYFLLGGDGDDVVQEGLLGLLKAVNAFSDEGGASFKTYATTCIITNIRTAVKRYGSKGNTPLNFAVAMSEETASYPSPDEGIIDEENEKELAAEVKNILSQAEYEVFRLYIEGRSYLEIAALTGESTKSVDNAIQRIKKKLIRSKV